MKKMKYRFLYTMSAIALAAGICTSCQKETEPSPDPGTSGGQVTVIATISDGGTKVSYSESGSNLNQSWTAGDHIVGWDASGKKIELEIKDESMIKDGTAIFTPVTGSAAVPSSGKVYMIYAPGKSYTDVSEKSLTYNLSSQDGSSVPALMTATGTVSGNTLTLYFTNVMAIVAVKNPKLPVSEATTVTNLTLNGSNILTTATFGMNGETLTLTPSVPGSITKACSFTTAADGNTANTTVYFAVLPNTTAADVTVKTVDPAGYEITKANKSFAAGKCYMLTAPEASKQQFSITVADGIEHGTITTSPEGTCAWDETVTVTAEPSEGYELATLTYNDGSDHDIKAVGTFTMPQSDVTVSGSFQKKDYAITADVTPTSGTYTVTGGTYTIKKGSDDVTKAQIGDEITVDATPADGYLGGTVTVKKTGTDEGVTFDVTNKKFTMPAFPVTITVTFRSGYSITKAPATNGSFTVKKGGTEVDSADSQDEITIEAAPATGYVVDAIGVRDADDYDKAAVAVTGDDKFTMPAKAVTVTVTFKPNPTTKIGVHEYVEIGGKKWATTNLGADIPQYYGNLYSWGNPTGSNGDNITSPGFTEKNYGSPGKDVTEDTWETKTNDAAYNDSNWGSHWRMPTKEDFVDLAANCVWIWTTDYKKTGVKGYIVYVAKNDDDKGKANMNGIWKKWDGSSSYTDASAATETYGVTDPHIFFPAAGYSKSISRSKGGERGYYWSSNWSSDKYEYNLLFNSGVVEPQNNNTDRYSGRSVRPVSD